MAGNVIADAGLWGVAAVLAGATGNLIENNSIGVAADGSTPLPHSDDGVRLYVDAADNTIQNNTIAFNAGNGVGLRSDSGGGNRITGNSIFSNGFLGIDLNLDGVTANDTGDVDVGPNDLQNFPVLSAIATATDTVDGTLHSGSEQTFTVELFSSPGCDPTGHGQGRVFLGSGAAVTDISGDATFAIASVLPLEIGEFITATATDPAGSTSEFSACFEVPLFADGFEGGNASAWSGSFP